MKKITLIIITSLIFINLSYAGGDDRDQVLPLNSLNDEADASPTFLQESEIKETVSDEYKAKEIDLSNQTNISTENLNIQDEIEVNVESKIKSFINKYLKSEQALLAAVILIFVGFIFLLSFF